MLNQTKIYILQLGEPPKDILDSVGDISTWFYAALHEYKDSIEIIKVFADQELPQIDVKNLAILTGSWSMVTEKKLWSERTAIWIREAVVNKMPLFGICYGHQLLSYALGGSVNFHPDGIEIGCKQIYRTHDSFDDPLLHNINSEFYTYLTHRQTITKVPEGTKVLAFSNHDNHQILRYNQTTVSVQFHPEFTPHIAKTMIKFRSSQLKKEGINVEEIYDEIEVRDAVGIKVLKVFLSQHFQAIEK